MSILTGKLLKEIEKIAVLDDDSFEKALFFAANIIRNHDNSNYLHELIEIDANDEKELVNIVVNFLSVLAKFKMSEKEFGSLMETTKLEAEKVALIKKVLDAH
mmetsp:Transcript_4129/g.3508  ORF Transcript_4129/g.3508 Transcript_4129/m.3508 type:complete len:103 (-) Transcript_4129:57-365(-)